MADDARRIPDRGARVCRALLSILYTLSTVSRWLLAFYLPLTAQIVVAA